MTLTQRVKTVRHSNAVAAGQTTITPSIGVDTKGFRTCRFVVLWGAITSGGAQSIAVHTSSDDGDADSYTALTGTGVTVADNDDNKLTIVEVVKPRERYLKCIISRATQDSAIDGILAELGDPDTAPISQDATVADAEIHHAPAEGSA